MTDELIKVLEKFGHELVSLAIANLKAKGKFGSGRLAKSMKPEVKEAAEKILLQVEAEEHAKYVNEGRRPGKMPPVKVIEAWITTSGLPIPKSAAFGIARNIGRFGMEPSHFWDDAVKMMLPTAKKMLESATKEAVTKAIKNATS